MLCSMLSERLRDARERAKLTQAELALKAGVRKTLISDIERGKTLVPGYDKVVKIACALSIRAGDLCQVDCPCGSVHSKAS
jgi:transcriptional regulator with XRE-family HTH domain